MVFEATTTSSSSAQIYTSRDGRFQYTIRSFDRTSEEEVIFLRRRLSREVPGSMSSFLRVAMREKDSVVLLAFHSGNLARTDDQPVSTQPAAPQKPIGMILFDTTPIAEHELAAWLWASVTFDASGVGVGSQLVAEGERAVKLLGAKVVEASSVHSSNFYHRVGYGRCVNPVYYTPHAAQKVLGGPDSASGHVNVSLKVQPAQDGNGDDQKTAPTSVPPKSGEIRTHGGKRERDEVTSSVTVKREPPQPLPSSPPRKRATIDSAAKRRTTQLSDACSSASSSSTAAGQSDSRPTTSSSSSDPLPSSSSSSSPSDKQEESDESDKDGKDDYGVQYDIPDVPDVIASGGVYLRLATPEDKRTWWDLILATTHYNVGGTELLPSTLEAKFRVVAVRRADNAFVGLVAMQSDGWVTFLCTDESYQGQGLGSFLLFIALEWARRHGLPSASLSPLRSPLVRFYRRWGFVEDDMRDGKKKKKHQEGAIITMTRKFDPTFALLPNAMTLAHFIGGYDASTEMTSQDGRTYYWYYPKRKSRHPPRTKPPAKGRTAPVGSAVAMPTSISKQAIAEVETYTPFSVKVQTLWSWLSPADRTATKQTAS